MHNSIGVATVDHSIPVSPREVQHSRERNQYRRGHRLRDDGRNTAGLRGLPRVRSGYGHLRHPVDRRSARYTSLPGGAGRRVTLLGPLNSQSTNQVGCFFDQAVADGYTYRGWPPSTGPTTSGSVAPPRPDRQRNQRGAVPHTGAGGPTGLPIFVQHDNHTAQEGNAIKQLITIAFTVMISALVALPTVANPMAVDTRLVQAGRVAQGERRGGSACLEVDHPHLSRGGNDSPITGMPAWALR